MKKINFIGFIITSVLGLIQLGNAASITNLFVSTDGNSNVSQFGFYYPLNGGWYFGVYDENMNNGLLLLEGTTVFQAKFEVYQINNELNNEGKWKLKITQGVDVNKTMSLGDSESFSFFFKNSDNYYEPYSISEKDGNYYFYGPPGSSGEGERAFILGVDLQAVPIPSTVWLLSSITLLFIFSRKETIKN